MSVPGTAVQVTADIASSTVTLAFPDRESVRSFFDGVRKQRALMAQLVDWRESEQLELKRKLAADHPFLRHLHSRREVARST